MRKFIILVLCIVMGIVLLTGCSANTSYTIGLAQFAEHSSLDNCREGFIAGLASEGFVEGENVTFDYQNANADTSIAGQIATNMVSSKYNLICAIATPMAMAAVNAADGKDIPVIYSAISDPVSANLATQDGTSDYNTTGTSDRLPVEKQLQMIRALMPNATKLGILYNTGEVNSVSAIAEYKALAGDYGFEIVEGGITAVADVPLATDAILAKVDCLTNLTDNTVVSALDTVLDKANEKGIPVFGSEIEQVKKGCVAAEGIDYYNLGMQTGQMAARVLKGEKAAEIPFETISESAMYYNPQAMTSLGLSIPDDLQDKATDVTAE